MVQDASGGVAIVDSRGSYARLGAAPADDRATLTLSEAYPARGEPIEIRLSSGSGEDAPPREIQVLWGDDTRRVYAPGDDMIHRYPDQGDHEIVAMVMYDDNTTRSAMATVHVGGTPPRDLTPLQKVFEPENADALWGVIGVLIAVFAGLMAIARSRVRKNRLEYRLAEIERIKKRGEYDTIGAIRDLDTHRKGLRNELRRGRLDDIQYAVLETEIQRSLRLFYHRLLTPFEDHMSNRFRERLAGSLEDGTLHPPEAARLLEDLAGERRLSRTEKDQLRQLFRDWSHREGAGTG